MDALRIFEAGGFVMYPLLFMSLAAVAFAVERFLAYRQFGEGAPGLLDEVVGLVKQGRASEALQRAEETPGPVAATIAAVLATRNSEIEDIEREVAVTMEDYFVRLERFLPWLDTFTTLSPLLGLLGTILGMVKVFQEFRSANMAGTGGATETLLAGVGESLYATAFGIAIAIFCFFAYNYFAAKQRHVSVEAQQAATKMISLLHQQRIAPQLTAGQIIEGKKRRETRPTRGRELKKTKVEIIPMIDTMFFLLVFFILQSVGLIKTTGNVKLPGAETGERKKPAQITVAVNPDQSVKVNNLPLASAGEDIAPLLEKEVASQMGRNPKPEDLEQANVIIQADKAVPSVAVVKTLNAISSVGFGRVTLATDNK